MGAHSLHWSDINVNSSLLWETVDYNKCTFFPTQIFQTWPVFEAALKSAKDPGFHHFAVFALENPEELAQASPAHFPGA